MESNLVTFKYCLRHGRTVFVMNNEQGKPFHTPVIVEDSRFEEQFFPKAVTDENLIVEVQQCLGPFAEVPPPMITEEHWRVIVTQPNGNDGIPPAPLTEEQWQQIFMMEEQYG